MEYEKAPWVEATVKTMVPEPSANMLVMWFCVNHGCDETILCPLHYNGNDDEVIPTDFMRQNLEHGKTCIVCCANELSDRYFLWPPDYQRKTIVKMAARIKAFFAIMGEHLEGRGRL